MPQVVALEVDDPMRVVLRLRDELSQPSYGHPRLLEHEAIHGPSHPAHLGVGLGAVVALEHLSELSQTLVCPIRIHEAHEQPQPPRRNRLARRLSLRLPGLQHLALASAGAVLDIGVGTLLLTIDDTTAAAPAFTLDLHRRQQRQRPEAVVAHRCGVLVAHDAAHRLRFQHLLPALLRQP